MPKYNDFELDVQKISVSLGKHDFTDQITNSCIESCYHCVTMNIKNCLSDKTTCLTVDVC